MDEQILQRLNEQDTKLDAIYTSAEKTRKYILFTMWMSIVFIVLPLIGMVFVIPAFINSYTAALGGGLGGF